MAEAKREHELYMMILNISSALAEVQQSLLALADTSAFTDRQKLAILRHNEAISAQFNELTVRAKAYQSL